MKSNLNLKDAMTAAADSKQPLLRLVGKTSTVPTAALTGEALRLDQYRRQNAMLQEALKNAATAPTEAMLAKQHQAVHFDAATQDTIAKQAAKQEDGGSIFSRGYSRFHFV